MMEKGKSKFSIGERVLCFEPDRTKARVLYDAKILDIDFGKEGRSSKKEAEYKIHFQGWNSAWDRWANENFVLKSTEENKKYQRKLARRAIKKLKKHRGRKRAHLPGVATAIKNATSSDSGSSSEDSEEDDSPPSQKRRQKKPPTPHPSDDVAEEEPGEPLPPSVGLQRRFPPLEFPAALKTKLEHDNNMITRQHMVVSLPARLSVTRVLENYVKHFAVHLAKLPSSEKVMKGNSQSSDLTPPEKNLNVCKEFCQDLRLLIDFALPLVLLYDVERPQHQALATGTRLRGKRKLTKSDTAASAPGSDSGNPPRKRKLSKHSRMPPHHRKSAEEQLIEETHTYLLPHQPNLDRTGLSNDARGRRRSSRLSHHPPSDDAMTSPPSSPLSDVTHGPPASFTVSMDPIVFLRPPPNHHHGALVERGGTPLSLLCRDEHRFSCSSPSIHFNQMCCEAYVAAAGDDIKKAVLLLETWNFTLFPSDYQPPEGAGVPLSLIYGIQHLLRLFVKLPEIVASMALPDHRLKTVHKHARLLLRFIADYAGEIFAASPGYVTSQYRKEQTD